MNNLTHYRCVNSSNLVSGWSLKMLNFFIEIQMQIIALEDPINMLLVRGQDLRLKMWCHDVMTSHSWRYAVTGKTIVHSTFIIQRLQTFSKNIVINAFINVYYYFWNVYYIYDWWGTIVPTCNCYGPQRRGMFFHVSIWLVSYYHHCTDRQAYTQITHHYTGRPTHW